MVFTVDYIPMSDPWSWKWYSLPKFCVDLHGKSHENCGFNIPTGFFSNFNGFFLHQIPNPPTNLNIPTTPWVSTTNRWKPHGWFHSHGPYFHRPLVFSQTTGLTGLALLLHRLNFLATTISLSRQKVTVEKVDTKKWHPQTKLNMSPERKSKF